MRETQTRPGAVCCRRNADDLFAQELVGQLGRVYPPGWFSRNRAYAAGLSRTITTPPAGGGPSSPRMVTHSEVSATIAAVMAPRTFAKLDN